LEKEIEQKSVEKEELSHSDSIIFNSGRRVRKEEIQGRIKKKSEKSKSSKI
jgi:hypothetical protein